VLVGLRGPLTLAVSTDVTGSYNLALYVTAGSCCSAPPSRF